MNCTFCKAKTEPVIVNNAQWFGICEKCLKRCADEDLDRRIEEMVDYDIAERVFGDEDAYRALDAEDNERYEENFF